ncbi:MAG: hypothetical protein ACRCW1_05775 [Anaerotignaceae bacterium]
MKKLTFLAILCFIFTLTTTSVYAATKQTEVSITSTFNFEKSRMSTFDEQKTIAGAANKGTEIEIMVYTLDEDGEVNEEAVYNITVGKTGLFTQTIDVYLGENYVEFHATEGTLETFEESTVVNRKS